MIRALIFDFDGLIVDTEWPDFLAWQEMCQHYGVELTAETWAPCIGSNSSVSKFEPFAYLQERVQVELDREEIYARFRQRHQVLIEAQPILPGVEELIKQARQRNLRVAVASSSPRSWVAGHLSRLGLLDAFDMLTCGDEVEHVKPYPDIYQLALDKLAIQPEQAIALEDSVNGMLSARRAGIFCVVVTNPLTQLLQFEQVDLRLKSLADLSLDKLLAQRVLP